MKTLEEKAKDVLDVIKEITKLTLMADKLSKLPKSKSEKINQRRLIKTLDLAMQIAWGVHTIRLIQSQPVQGGKHSSIPETIITPKSK